MPKDLAALLAEDGAVPAEVLERALARQREAGGALDTALLEEGAGEEALIGCLARAAELPSAPDAAWNGKDARARRVFPSRVAERHGLAPFALDGKELSLVATYPVDIGLLDEISFMLSLHLTVHVGLEWRVRELIHRLYGTPLSPRLAALSAATSAAAARGSEAASSPREAGETQDPRPPPPLATGFSRDESESLEPLAAALAQALESAEVFAFEDVPASDQEPLAEEPPEAGGEVAAPEEAAPPPDRSAPPRWTLEEARAALAATRHRDGVVLAALRYARDFFEFAAMFAVTRDAVAGHDALGTEEARDRARSVAIWAADPGIFRTVIETESPYLGPVAPGAAGTDTVLHGLGREPRTVLVYPVLLRHRPVCILYADNGEAPVSPRRLGDLLLFLSGVGPSFERIIRDRKGPRRPAARAEAPAPPVTAAPAHPDPLPSRAPEASADAAAGPSATAGHSEERAPGADAPTAATPAAASTPTATPTAASTATATPATAEPSVASTHTPPPVAQPPDPAMLAALADRALDPDPDIAAAACAALGARRRDRAIRPASEKLRRALLSGIAARTGHAARAIGALRDVEAIPLLIQVLETSEPETANAAAEALSTITLQRLGSDARRWLGWWKQNRGRGRAEWLFSGLTNPERETRVAASVELSLAAPPPVAYSADMPADEREKAARDWAGWWSRSGHVL